MSSISPEAKSHTTVDTIAGFLAAAACTLALLAIVRTPIRYAPVAIVLAIVAARMSPRWERLSLAAAALAMVGWLLGMTFAVITDNPLF
jgi:hypothetical protein